MWKIEWLPLARLRSCPSLRRRASSSPLHPLSCLSSSWQKSSVTSYLGFKIDVSLRRSAQLKVFIFIGVIDIYNSRMVFLAVRKKYEKVSRFHFTHIYIEKSLYIITHRFLKFQKRKICLALQFTFFLFLRIRDFSSSRVFLTSNHSPCYIPGGLWGWGV